MDKLIFNKQNILQGLQNNDTFTTDIRDFISSGSICLYEFSEQQQKELIKTEDVAKYAIKFLEFALYNWFGKVRGE